MESHTSDEDVGVGRHDAVGVDLDLAPSDLRTQEVEEAANVLGALEHRLLRDPSVEECAKRPRSPCAVCGPSGPPRWGRERAAPRERTVTGGAG
jgi:hypothetical protein